MSNNVLLPPETSGSKAEITLRPIESVHLSSNLVETEEGLFHSLIGSVRDVFFPKKLPPLVLESTPIPVIDRMAVKRDPTATIISTVLNVTVMLIVLWFAAHQIVNAVTKKPVEISIVDPITPPKAPPKAQTMGGGGGQPDKAPVSKGNPPKFAPDPINPPKAPPLEQPKIKMPDPTIDVDPNLKMAKTDLPNFGMTNAPSVNGSLGMGHGNGIGNGNGAGLGNGSGGGTGGGVRRPGGGVSAPQVLYQPEPEFSEEARKAKVSGNVRVLRGIGLGLDEKAIDAVRRYKFKPAMENGKPVVVEMQVEVNFQIF